MFNTVNCLVVIKFEALGKKLNSRFYKAIKFSKILLKKINQSNGVN